MGDVELFGGHGTKFFTILANKHKYYIIFYWFSNIREKQKQASKQK
jgi:hypothetical protein